jgi:hypothetical protein
MGTYVIGFLRPWRGESLFPRPLNSIPMESPPQCSVTLEREIHGPLQGMGKNFLAQPVWV